MIADIVEVVADEMRLRADAQNVVADALDQRRPQRKEKDGSAMRYYPV